MTIKMVGCCGSNFCGMCGNGFSSCNQAAHVLANYSLCNKLSSNWTNEAPACLVSTLVDDVISA